MIGATFGNRKAAELGVRVDKCGNRRRTRVMFQAYGPYVYSGGMVGYGGDVGVSAVRSYDLTDYVGFWIYQLIFLILLDMLIDSVMIIYSIKKIRNELVVP